MKKIILSFIIAISGIILFNNNDYVLNPEKDIKVYYSESMDNYINYDYIENEDDNITNNEVSVTEENKNINNIDNTKKEDTNNTSKTTTIIDIEISDNSTNSQNTSNDLEDEKNDNLEKNNSFNEIEDKKSIYKEDKMDKTDLNKIILVDESNGQSCVQAIEYFYEDAYYKYYFTCIKSQNMYVIKKGRKYKLVDALKEGIVTIEELAQNGYSFPKTSKNTVSK